MTWSDLEITHLFMRASFGISKEEAELALQLGKEETVRRLVSGESLDGGSDYLPSAGEVIERVNEQKGKLGAQMQLAQNQWIYRLIHTRTPFIEKMTLFWHDHFATNAKKIDNGELMVTQNELFRTLAAGDFKELIRKISRDPAMLIWLDANQNQKGKPNENYARELMELFTLGIGHYTEKDVKETARAFTGWRADKKTGEVQFREKLHDSGEKLILGETGKWNDMDVIEILFRQQALSRFIVKKLLTAYAAQSPSQEWIERLAERFRERYVIGDVLTALFLSPEFWEPEQRQGLVKAPVDYVIWIVRAFGLQMENSKINSALKQMGQELYYPPDVNGWPSGEEWLGSNSLLARYRFAETAAGLAVKERRYPEHLETPSKSGDAGAEAWVDAWIAHLRLTPISATTKEALIRYLTDSGKVTAGKKNATMLKGLIHLILISPEAQMK
ncbi:DUF1800 domain-containing protein [Paenibacillus sp. GD4]|uniref:DUF1800 domain-containing protein n=1 Tax=Paenibacillus sp. GD4 TaxID=3068890 RepID=UPI0027968EE5|nr:DUF1800 domain-containing protein [Paenibacillus sp. GD4]MDQ1912787.1 DUF1800 domain-containing protein [Paenibacillus sp. GD4]